MTVDASLPVHKEWWFRVLVSVALASFLHWLGKLRKSQASHITIRTSEEERLQRLLNSRLLTGEGELNDLSLDEEVHDGGGGTADYNASTDPTLDKDDAATHLSKDKLNERGKSGSFIVSDVHFDDKNDDEKNSEQVPAPTSESSPTTVSLELKGMRRQRKPDREPQDESSSPTDFPQSLTMGHPGMHAFWHWWDVSTSLFRIYTLTRTDGVEVSPPYIPSSRRGVTPIALRVTNGMKDDLVVYWVDYKGNYVHKGVIHPNQTWYQSTWIDHPWVFCYSGTEIVILHYIPYRVIPTTNQQPTVDPEEPEVGVHRFTIRPSKNPTYYCLVSDAVLPYPAQDFFLTAEIAVAWTLLHCHRMSFSMHIEWNTLIKYLSKILQNPAEPKYRKIRLSNHIFSPVWNSPLRGLLLAAGFVEHHEFLYLGQSSDPLPRERVQELAQLVYHLEQWKRYKEDDPASSVEQPEGADGFGRAGYGRLGMNL